MSLPRKVIAMPCALQHFVYQHIYRKDVFAARPYYYYLIWKCVVDESEIGKWFVTA